MNNLLCLAINFFLLSGNCSFAEYNSPIAVKPIVVRQVATMHPELIEFAPYIREFQRLYKVYTGDTVERNGLKVEFAKEIDSGIYGVEEGHRVAGVCNRKENVIYIKESYWNLATEPEKKKLMYHELGHCLLYLGHDKIGIMNALGEDPHSLEPNFLKYFFLTGKNAKTLFDWERSQAEVFEETPNDE